MISRSEIRDSVVEIINDANDEVDAAHVDDEAQLRDALGLDSMDFLDIVLGLRKKFHLEIPEADYPHFRTMKGSVDYLEMRLGQADKK